MRIANNMITFLPTPNFVESASMLDSKRLGNQRVEARMILRWLRNKEDYPRQQNAGYTVMWRGYEDALCLYYNACCEEWARRGGRNVVCQPEKVDARRAKMPPWLGDDELHVTHRSALLHKLPGHFEQFGWDVVDPKVDYLWPRPVEGGKEGEYELSGAFWKKGKRSSSSSSKTNGATTTKAAATAATTSTNRAAKRKTRTKSAVEKKRKSMRENQGQGRYPSRRPRRSPRLAGTDEI